MNETLINNARASAPPWLAGALAAIKPRHWLLDSIYGRELLKQRFIQLVPSMQLPLWSDCHEFDPVFDLLIDDLGLRHLGRPRTIRERIVYFRTILCITQQLQSGGAE